MKGTKKTSQTITLEEINVKSAKISIVGDSDLILNKMNNVVVRSLIDARKNKAVAESDSNVWEEIITSIHWYNGNPDDFSEEGMKNALIENCPCITTHGLIKSFAEAVVRNNIDTYSTKLRASVNVIGKGGLVPIKFAEHHIDELLMQPMKGKPVLARLNRFTGWSAEFTIQYTENAYSLEQILNIIKYAGFGGGIGSSRNNGYGRYHIADVSAIY